MEVFSEALGHVLKGQAPPPEIVKLLIGKVPPAG